MPNQRAYLLRIEFLKACLEATHKDMQEAETPEIKSKHYASLRMTQGRLFECRDWLRAITEHGDYGSLYLQDGRWVPRVPILGSSEAIKGAVEDRELGMDGENRAYAVDARSRSARKRSQNVAAYLSENAAILNDEES